MIPASSHIYLDVTPSPFLPLNPRHCAVTGPFCLGFDPKPHIPLTVTPLHPWPCPVAVGCRPLITTFYCPHIFATNWVEGGQGELSRQLVGDCWIFPFQDEEGRQV